MFILIDFLEPAQLVNRIISIHLMFILIQNAELSHMVRPHFNTSHVYINRCTGGHQPPAFTDFNTSHVYINPFLSGFFTWVSDNFNTSHVYINQHKRKQQQKCF